MAAAPAPSFESAVATGARRYLGTPCRMHDSHGPAVRYTSNRACVLCKAARQRGKGDTKKSAYTAEDERAGLDYARAAREIRWVVQPSNRGWIG